MCGVFDQGAKLMSVPLELRNVSKYLTITSIIVLGLDHLCITFVQKVNSVFLLVDLVMCA